MADPMTCVLCKNGTATEQAVCVAPYQFPVTGYVCDECGEAFFTTEQAREANRQHQIAKEEAKRQASSL